MLEDVLFWGNYLVALQYSLIYVFFNDYCPIVVHLTVFYSEDISSFGYPDDSGVHVTTTRAVTSGQSLLDHITAADASRVIKDLIPPEALEGIERRETLS